MSESKFRKLAQMLVSALYTMTVMREKQILFFQREEAILG